MNFNWYVQYLITSLNRFKPLAFTNILISTGEFQLIVTQHKLQSPGPFVSKNACLIATRTLTASYSETVELFWFQQIDFIQTWHFFWSAVTCKEGFVSVGRGFPSVQFVNLRNVKFKQIATGIHFIKWWKEFHAADKQNYWWCWGKKSSFQIWIFCDE